MLNLFVCHKSKQPSSHPSPLHPQTQPQCNCQFCTTYTSKQFSKTMNIRRVHQAKKLTNLLNQSNLKTKLEFILERLIIPSNKITTSSVNIFIPDIVYFKQGQLKSLYMTKKINDATVRKSVGEKLSAITASKMLNERRWKYRTLVLNKKNSYAKVDSKQSVILQFTDGYQKMLSEIEFSEIIQKRKQDPFWKSVHSFKNFVLLNKQKTIIKYRSNKSINEELFARAEIVTLINAKNIVEDEEDKFQEYISQDSEETYCWMLIQSGEMEELFTYLTYKIVKFVEKFHDTMIVKGEFQWAVDELKRPLLLDVQRLETKQMIPYDWTEEIFQKKQEEIRNNLFWSKDVKKIKGRDCYSSDKIQEVIGGQYSRMKERFGFNKNDEMPSLRYSSEIKSKMAVKKTKPQRKPLFSEFNSNMIRMLHSLTSTRKKPSLPVEIQSPGSSYLVRRSVQSKHLSTNISEDDNPEKTKLRRYQPFA